MLRAAVIAAAAVTLVGACGGGDAPADQAGAGATSSPSPSSAAGNATVPPPAALDFSAPTVGGGELDLRAYAGTPVAFWFWAPY